MDKFLEVVYTNQLADSEKGDMFAQFFEKFLNRLKDIVSEKVFDELEELFTDCVVQNDRYYAVEGMKLAIGIMDGTYIPKV